MPGGGGLILAPPVQVGLRMLIQISPRPIALFYIGAGDPRNHPVIYGNMYFWQLRYHAKIATPLWSIHKLSSKKYLDKFFLIYIYVKKNPLLHVIIKPRKKEHLLSQ